METQPADVMLAVMVDQGPRIRCFQGSAAGSGFDSSGPMSQTEQEHVLRRASVQRGDAVPSQI